MRTLTFRAMGLVTCITAGAASPGVAQTFTIEDAGDFGNSHPSYPPSKAVDGNTAFSSRWAASHEDGSAILYVDLGEAETVDDIGVAWGRGDRRSYNFEIRARAGTQGSWSRIFSGQSSGDTTQIEQYNVDDFSARQIRIQVFSNSAGTDWADITEFEVYGTSGPGQRTTTRDSRRVDVPGLIQAEDFSDYKDNDTNNQGGKYLDTGVDIQECSDSGCGFNIGWTEAGEWLEYEIDVANSGTYEAQVRVASPRDNGRFSIAIDGSRVSGTTSVNKTNGWQRWRTQTVNLGEISAGEHALRLNIVGGEFNINWMNIVSDDNNDGPIVPINTIVGEFGLDPNAEPWDNFNLTKWSLDTPAPRPNDRCKAERTWDYSWRTNDPLNESSQPFFFTHTDGGMRFVTRVGGQTTSDSCNSGFVRSELREMLRVGERDIDDTGVSKNNWKLGYQPGRNSDWGGVNGRLDTTLRVNRVTTSGSSSQVGRVIIGQIHAGNDEPLRLYYRKRVGQDKGCIYFAHEIRGADDIRFTMIGDTSCTSAPSDGIALNELFSYTIINDAEDITVTIRRGDKDGRVIASKTIDMDELNSGYDRSDEWMYFKAGAYTQNDTGDDNDGDIVTIYRLSTSHD